MSHLDSKTMAVIVIINLVTMAFAMEVMIMKDVQSMERVLILTAIPFLHRIESPILNSLKLVVA